MKQSRRNVRKPSLHTPLRTLLALLALGLTLTAQAAPTRAPWHFTMFLVRWDAPLGFKDGYGHTRQSVQRVPGPDAVDWPQMSLNGRPLFGDKAEEAVTLPLRTGGEATPLFQQPTDDTIQPGGHWLRPLEWIWNQHFVYTNDRTARAWDYTYELWTFPVRVTPAPGAMLQSVTLRVGQRVFYERHEPLHSLTLLLPASAPNQPYTLSVNGSRPVSFPVGLAPIRPGDPQDEADVVQMEMDSPTGHVTISNGDIKPPFIHAAEWQADLDALHNPTPSLPAPPPPLPGFLRHLGRDTPHSPLAIHAAGLPSGMSTGYVFNSGFPGTLDQYADLLAETGYDDAFEQTEVDSLASPDPARSYDRWAQLLAQRGIGTILVPDVTFLRPFANNPNLAFEASSLPDSHTPLYRDLQLEAQRLARWGNFRGMSIGADNAGYVPYWDWAPPNPNRPWAEAFLQFEQGHAAGTPVGGDNTPAHDYEHKGTARQFVDYLARYDATLSQYGYFSHAVMESVPGAVATSGSFGSSPGVGGRGGWPWASIPGEALFRPMPVQQAYDWNEQRSTLPLHLEALLDRLRSADPAKPTWAIVDDFNFHLTRLSRQRAYALALTRGVQSVGTTWLAHKTGPDARPQTVAEQKELYAWIHKYGGAYAMARTAAPLGILYVQPQALLRPTVFGEYPSDAQLLRGSHEGKTTEALFLCHAAGWPARLVTPAELRRGLPPEMHTLLLVGLNVFDASWHWYDGLQPALRAFTKRGGALLRDDESVCPVPSQPTGLSLRAYVPNRDRDWTPELFARNTNNIAKLRQALRSAPPPVAQSPEPTVWAIPTISGNTQYVTVVNQGYDPARDAGQFVRPQKGKLTWHTARPIYDVRLARRITPAEAATCDLTQDAFRWYALPPAPVSRPIITTNKSADGFYTARATINPRAPLTGIPLQWTLEHGGMRVHVYSATGLVARLPLAAGDAPGPYTLTVTELLSQLSSATTITVPAPPPAPPLPAVIISQPGMLRRFAARRAVPLVIALTTAQADDPALQKIAQRLAAFYRAQGRTARVGRAAPSDTVLGLQPLHFPMRYPQWRTQNVDMVLLGTPSASVLLLDQARAGLLPDGISALPPGHAVVSEVLSAFAGERDTVNLLATDDAGLSAAAARLEQVSRP